MSRVMPVRYGGPDAPERGDFYRLGMPDLAVLVAANVRGERSRRRWRQQDLADHLGWSQATVSDLEAGKRAVNVADLPPLCRVLGITLNDLFRGAAPEDLRSLGM